MKDTRIPDIIIENIERVDWEDFDTIILGHMGQLAQLVKQPDLAMDLAREALLRGKKVVAFDDLRIVETGLPMDKVYCPVVRKEHMPGNRFGKLYRCPKPVLGIFGTSSRPGEIYASALSAKRTDVSGLSRRTAGNRTQFSPVRHG